MNTPTASGGNLPSNGHRVVRWLLLTLTLATTAAALRLYYEVVQINGVNVLEYALLPLFAVLFAWIAFSFWTATIGLVVILSRRQQRTSARLDPDHPLQLTHTAVLIPIYNESPAHVFASVQAMLRSVLGTGQAEDFDFFVLSDTTDPDVWLDEERAWARLVAENGSRPRVFYRRRPRNVSRKSGNIADFCTRWGSQYEYMIVLDADSIMEGATLVEMVRRMDADPRLGILQVPPTPVNLTSVFARLQQFSARMYGDVFLQGFASWAHFDSNYWGHNAIIRVEPFTACCGLPLLPGKPPLGGEILSHDFVEAALMARAGWKVALAHDLGGSYEECPSTLLDFAKRDQRWCQGNMQHIRLIFSEGFRPISRMHLTMGVMSYLSSPLWLAFMILSVGAMLMDGAQTAATLPWMARAGTIFGLTMAMLLLPKLWSLIALTRQPARLRDFGGWDNVVGSVLLESMISFLLAPIMMFFHTRFVLATLMGEQVHWHAQNRGEGEVSLDEALIVYGPHTLLGLFLAAVIGILSPALLIWFLPVVTGLALSVPIAKFLGSVRIGKRLARQGLLLIPEEIFVPELLHFQREELRWQRRVQSQFDREQLFDTVLTDPSFHALHRNILHATDSHVPAKREDLRAIADLLRRDGPSAVPGEFRRVLLSDAEALRKLHVQLRSQLRLNRSALSS